MSAITFNEEGIVRSLIRNRALQSGYEATPLIGSDGQVLTAPTGTYIYQFRCLGATDAVIDSITNTQGAPVAGFAGVTITAADVPYNYLCTVISITSGTIIAYVKNISDL